MSAPGPQLCRRRGAGTGAARISLATVAAPPVSVAPLEEILMCQLVQSWRTELDGVIAFMDDYRSADPEVVRTNPSLTTLESETLKLLV